MTPISSTQLLKTFPDLLQSASVEQTATHIAPCENYVADSLVFCSSQPFIDSIAQSPPSIVVTTDDLAKLLLNALSATCCVISTSNIRLAQALIKQQFGDYNSRDEEWGMIHPSACIHDSAQIGEGCHIGPNTVIGANVSMGDNCIVRANSVIEHDVQMGQDCVIHNVVNIGYGCELGDRVTIRSGSCIGNEGFGYAPDENKAFHRIPHTGNVILADDVHIGANCNIDRGTYGSTRIGRGSKLDALCHIAHNVQIGEDCVIVAQCGIAGSTVIGDRVMMSGQTGILDHKKIADDVVLVHRSGVITDIEEPGMWAGLPSLPFKKYMREQRAVHRSQQQIEKLKQQLDRLQNELHMIAENNHDKQP